MKGCSREVTELWRNSPVVVTVATMLDISQLPKDQQVKAFKSAIAAPGGTNIRGKRRISDNVLNEITCTANLLGRLERAGLITSNVDFEKDFLHFVKNGGVADGLRRKVLIDAAVAGYQKGIEGTTLIRTFRTMKSRNS
jgi:hypothetical protein